AEDGIRDFHVTGVQTCALPISRLLWGVDDDTPVIGSVARWNPLKDHENLIAALALSLRTYPAMRCVLIGHGMDAANAELAGLLRSEERRVGKEWRATGWCEE